MSPRLWILILATTACGEVPSVPDAAIDAAEPDARQGFTLTLLTPTPSVPVDGSNRIVVEVTRTGGFTGPVTISGVTPPAGLTVTPATISATATTGDVVIAGAAPLSVGGVVSLTLEASATGVPSQTVMLTNLPVTPKPGSLDTAFNGSGIGRISFGADDTGAFLGMEVFGGNVIATGYTIGGLGATRMVTMRFTAAGAPDPTWNGGMALRTGFTGSSGSADQAVAIGHQLDGRHIVIGSHEEGAAADIGVVRYSTTGGGGGVDFGNNGNALVNLGGLESGRGGIVQPDNKIIVVGVKDNHFLITRVDAFGFVDTSFNAPMGYERTVLGTSSSAEVIVVDSTERMLIGGTFLMAGQGELVLERRLPNGMLDAAFGTGGRVFVLGPDDESVVAVRTRSDKIYVASNATDGVNATYRVRRFLADGSLDTSYGTNGIADLPRMDGPVLDMIVLTDGRVVTLAQSGTSGLFGRFTQSGAIDTLFGTGGNGFVTVTIGGNGAPGALLNYNDQQIVFCGADSGGSPGPGTFGVVGRMWM